LAGGGQVEGRVEKITLGFAGCSDFLRDPIPKSSQPQTLPMQVAPPRPIADDDSTAGKKSANRQRRRRGACPGATRILVVCCALGLQDYRRGEQQHCLIGPGLCA
jgi:hypothetical protein